MLKEMFYLTMIFLIIGCTQDQEEESLAQGESEDVPELLPFETLPLSDLSSFKSPSDNWRIVGAVTSDLAARHDLSTEQGEGVLANVVEADGHENLLTEMEHGDLELHVDVMMPKGSNSGIYLQGRYEIQLLDSWMKDTIDFDDMGGIYQRWDDNRPEGTEGFDGIAPTVNAAKAPGLWQHIHLLFRAPRFDSEGKKIKDAMFEFVELNGHRIHHEVSISGPTRAATFHDEKDVGPIMFQGDHGPVAFRNFLYKSYLQDTLELSELKYKIYHGKWDYIPDWDTLTPAKSGEAKLLDPREVADQPDHYGLIFTGKLNVQIPGTYLFETEIDDGGDLLIDSTLVVHNEGEPGSGTERGLVELSAGVHNLTMTYYQEVWGASIRLSYEGPQISRRTLGSNIEVPAWVKAEQAKPKLLLQAEEKPELVRGFVNHGPVKTTHSISVGDPSGIHFSYNLDDGALIKSWRGPFADVTDMWRGRGISQLTTPLNAPIVFTAGLAVAKLSNDQASWPKYRPAGFSFLGYRLDSGGRPHFRYVHDQVVVEDHILPTSDGRLKRVMTFENANNSLWHRIGVAEHISRLDNGLYSVGGAYYISTDQNVQTRRIEKGEELLARITDGNSSTIEYEIIW